MYCIILDGRLVWSGTDADQAWANYDKEVYKIQDYRCATEVALLVEGQVAAQYRR